MMDDDGDEFVPVQVESLDKDFKEQLINRILNVDQIERDFSRMHQLVDRLLKPKSDMTQQNSHLFQLKLAMLLSAHVQE